MLRISLVAVAIRFPVNLILVPNDRIIQKSYLMKRNKTKKQAKQSFSILYNRTKTKMMSKHSRVFFQIEWPCKFWETIQATCSKKRDYEARSGPVEVLLDCDTTNDFSLPMHINTNEQLFLFSQKRNGVNQQKKIFSGSK